MEKNKQIKKNIFDAKSTRHWHRYLGFFTSVFALVLSVTGVLLNHTESLNLDSRYIQSDSLLSFYGIKAPDRPTGININGSWIYEVDRHLYFSSEKIIETVGPLVGAASMELFIIVAFENSVLVLSNTGELVEQLGKESGVPQDIIDIGISASGEAVLKTATGYFKTDSELLSWQISDGSSIRSAKLTPVPDNIYEKIKRTYMGSGLPLERVVLDLHSGRFFGLIGVYFWDSAAVILAILSITGLFLFYFPAGLQRRKK